MAVALAFANAVGFAVAGARVGVTVNVGVLVGVKVNVKVGKGVTVGEGVRVAVSVAVGGTAVVGTGEGVSVAVGGISVAVLVGTNVGNVSSVGAQLASTIVTSKKHKKKRIMCPQMATSPCPLHDRESFDSLLHRGDNVRHFAPLEGLEMRFTVSIYKF